MRKGFFLVGFAACAAASACSLFGFDGFSGGDDPVDAGADGTASTDAPTTSPDGGSLDDAGGGDATPSGPFCKTTGADASLCDDFEEPGTFTGKWPEKDFYLGKLEVLDGIGFGNSRGLRFTAASRNDGQIGQDARVVLGYTSPNVVARVDCEVAFRPTTIPAGMYMAGPIHVQLERAAGGRQAIGFYLDDKRTLSVNPIVFGPSDEVLAGGGGMSVTTLPANVWSRLRIVADVGAPTPALFVYVDGALKLEQEMTGFTPDKVSVRLGANYAGGTDAGIAFDLDDARIDWK